MKLLEVNSSETIALFHEVAGRIYRDDPAWIPHMYREIEHIFETGIQNVQGEIKRWVLLDRNFYPAGRIAAFYNPEKTDKIGAIGFYECINDETCSGLLFDQAFTWLSGKNVLGADGPINFGERHQFWGCLVSEERVPVYQENYNPGYYSGHFAQAGFSPLFDSVSYKLDLDEFPGDRIQAIYTRLSSDKITYRHFDMDHPDKFIEDYLDIAAGAFQMTNRSVKLDKRNIASQLNIQKGVLRNNLIYFAYHDNEPVGVVGFMLNWSGIIHDAIRMTPGGRQSLKGFLVAIKPAFQKKGVLPGLIHHVSREIRHDPRYERVYLCGIAGYSTGMHSMLRKLHARVIARHVTYRIYFDHRTVTPYPLFTNQ